MPLRLWFRPNQIVNSLKMQIRWIGRLSERARNPLRLFFSLFFYVPKRSIYCSFAYTLRMANDFSTSSTCSFPIYLFCVYLSRRRLIIGGSRSFMVPHWMNRIVEHNGKIRNKSIFNILRCFCHHSS